MAFIHGQRITDTIRKQTKDKKRVMPAKEFIGTKDEATAYAATLNIKSVRIKDKATKDNQIWEMIYHGNAILAGLSSREIQNKYGVLRNKVNDMRRARVTGSQCWRVQSQLEEPADDAEPNCRQSGQDS
jgi:hypothetical protein